MGRSIPLQDTVRLLPLYDVVGPIARYRPQLETPDGSVTRQTLSSKQLAGQDTVVRRGYGLFSRFKHHTTEEVHKCTL